MTEEAANAPIETPQEILSLVDAARSALTDSMVERLAVAGSNAMEVADRLNDDDTKDAIFTILDKLTELHRCGALDTVFDLVFAMHSARQAATDNIVERMFMLVERMLNEMANEELVTLAYNARRAMEQAIDETTAAPAKGGMMATLSMLNSAETQEAMQFMMRFGTHLRKRTSALRNTANLEP
jgi:uncharacterized protein YjgD (DUF1641 family)